MWLTRGYLEKWTLKQHCTRLCMSGQSLALVLVDYRWSIVLDVCLHGNLLVCWSAAVYWTNVQELHHPPVSEYSINNASVCVCTFYNFLVARLFVHLFAPNITKRLGWFWSDFRIDGLWAGLNTVRFGANLYQWGVCRSNFLPLLMQS